MNKTFNFLNILLTIFLVFIAVSAKAQGTDAEFENEFSKFENEISKGSVNDPLEKYNRRIFTFNETVDKYFFEKVARNYRRIVPKPARNCFRNFLNNLNMPLSAFNSFAQGKGENGFAAISSFLINSTLGIGGLFEIAKVKGIKHEPEDFGQTLGYYGLESNIYLVLPFFGPNNLRDLGGGIVDRSIDPLSFNLLEIGGKSDFIEDRYRIANTALGVIDTREELLDIIDNIRKDSFDPYATFRSAYLQRRLAQIEK